MTQRVLVIGHSAGLIDALARIAVDAPQVYLLVEPSVLEAHPGEFEHPIIAEIRTGRFIFSGEAVEVAMDWHANVEFDAVLPGKEHAVRAAAAIAGKLDLGYPGAKAIGACTDKLELRRVLTDSGFPTPRFRSIGNAAEVGEFFEFCNGRPIVLKPRERNGSLGSDTSMTGPTSPRPGKNRSAPTKAPTSRRTGRWSSPTWPRSI